MTRTPPSTSYTTRIVSSSNYDLRTPPESEYERPRFISSLTLCDSSGELLTDSSGELLVATGNPIIVKKIQTPYT